MPAHLIPGDGADTLRIPEAPERDQAAEVRVADAVLRQEQQGGRTAPLGVGTDRDFRSHDQVHSQFAGFDVGAHRAVHPVPVREGQSLQAQFVGSLHQLLGVARAFQEREVALAPEGGVGHGPGVLRHKDSHGHQRPRSQGGGGRFGSPFCIHLSFKTIPPGRMLRLPWCSARFPVSSERTSGRKAWSRSPPKSH